MRKIFPIGLFLFIFLIFSINLFAIGVKPLTLNLAGKPGETLSFKFTISPTDKPGIVNLVLYRVTQRLDGKKNNDPAEPGAYPPAAWFSFPSIIKVAPGFPSEVNGKVKIPLDAKGDYNMMVMVIPESEKVMIQGINIRVQYGVELNLKVNSLGSRTTAVVNDFNVVKDEQGLPEIRVQVKNTSLFNYGTYAYATVRNSQKKLVQKLDLLPDTYRDKINLGDPVLFPDGELLYTGKITEFLSPGPYEVRLFYRFSDNGQILQTKNIDVMKGDFSFPAAAAKRIKISPQAIALETKPGTMAMKAIKFENRLDKPVMIVVEPLSIRSNYPYSIFANTEIDLKGGKQFTIGANQMAVRIVTVRFAKNTPIQGNYGNLRIKVYSDEKNPTLIDESIINLSATVIGEKKRFVEFTNLTGDYNGGNYVVSAMFKNTGNVAISPKLKLVLRDRNDKLIDKVDLGDEGEESVVVLPDQIATIHGNLTKKIVSGEYEVEIKATEADTELGSSKFKLKVK